MVKSSILAKYNGAGIATAAMRHLQSLLVETGMAVKAFRCEKTTPFDFAATVQFADGTKKVILAEAKTLGEPRVIREIIGRITRQERRSTEYPIFVCPFISPRGRELCRDAGIGYLDLAGNCLLSWSGVHISHAVEENPFATTRPLHNLFSPRASRIVRALLYEPQRRWTQWDLSKSTGVSLGYANKIVRKMSEGHLLRFIKRKIHLASPHELLEQWLQKYDFSAHDATFCYSADPMQEIDRKLADYGSSTDSQYALTCFAGAEHRAPFTRFNQFHVYYSGDVPELIRHLSLKKVPTGANVVILRPVDDGVYYKMTKDNGINVVCDVQLYLDLMSLKGRGEDQARHLMEKTMPVLLGPLEDVESEVNFVRFREARDRGWQLADQGDHEAACVVFEQGLAFLKKITDRDVEKERLSMRLHYWLSAVHAAWNNLEKDYLNIADTLFQSQGEAERVAQKLNYNRGYLKLGLMVLYLVRAHFAEDEGLRKEMLKKAEQYYTVVKDSYTESHDRIAPVADKAWELRQRRF